MKRLLIIEDSHKLRESLTIILQNKYEVITLSTLIEGIDFLKKEKIDMIILGINELSWGERELIEELVEMKREIPLMLLGESGNLKRFQEFLGGYVAESIILPFKIFEIREKIKQILSGTFSSLYLRIHENRLIEKYQILFNSPIIENRIKKIIPNLFGRKSPVLLLGERGTWKEVIAKILHYLGSKNPGVFIKLDCSSLTESVLIERLKKALYPLVNLREEVSLYWEEIGRLKPEIQIIVEEILEEGIQIITRNLPLVSPRIIASSSEDLNELVLKGEFRENLWFRLNHFPLKITPLRERIEDFPDIAQEIIKHLCRKGYIEEKVISPEALETLKSYYWPGNLHELEEVIQRSCLLSVGSIISKEDIAFTYEEKTSEDKRTMVFPHSEISGKDESIFEQLLEGFVHEVMNPLVAIKTFTQLLPERFDDSEFRKHFYKIVGMSIERIEWLTKRISQYKNFLRPCIVQVNFPIILEEVINGFQERLKEKRITVQCKGLDTLSSLKILSDPCQLNFVLENILVHCLYDLPEGSQVHFTAKITNLKENEEKLFPLKDYLNEKVLELRIFLPSPSNLPRSGVSEFLQASTFYSIEIFLSQMIINRNLGIMEKKEAREAEVIVIKLPLSSS